ncbi:MAG TPA: alpha-glucan family phosphorylase [Kofleriaceae bacterium]|jgi:starch phosphorylase|nr:alpha-glucan family phosphorylase [Kofleriaceae bacterium]
MTTRPSVAYFCMEYGLAPEFTIYSGGLGVLAGDYVKSAGDLHMPVTAVGIFWGEGYTHQVIGDDGKPRDHYPPTPRDRLDTLPVAVEVVIRGKRVPLQVHKVRGLARPLYLLEPARIEDRWMTQRLYHGSPGDRLAQEVILGVGGVRALRALGIRPQVYHFNEGHAVFAGLEMVEEARRGGALFEQALAAVRRTVVFTTHTPVAAGNEVHPLPLMREIGACLDFSDAELERIGGSPFSMTVAGLRLARAANAVAELHGHTARAMWAEVSGAAPIVAITNGVHAPTWQDARVRAATAADKDADSQRGQLWDAHQEMKGELLAIIRERCAVELRGDRLLIGFARRAAPYKRATLIFSDPDRLDALFAADRLQLVFAGKAHPEDHTGKELIHQLVEASRRWPHHVVFLENYDMRLGMSLTRGCDVWLNNPRRPMEASGTSGMKAAMNGVLNMSILDGWWPEGCRHGETGWRIGEASDHHGQELAEGDRLDAEALYSVLEREVLPRYEGDRAGWVEMMRASVAMAGWRFSSDRMVEDYFRSLYR